MQTETKSIIFPYGQIYRLTNKVNGKMYHGQTTQKNINDRWKKYKYLNCKGQPKLYNALKKYGPKNFLFEVIDTTPQNQTQLDDLEIYYIAKFNSFHNGYNCNNGGNGNKGFKPTQEVKTKISNALKGKNSIWFGKTHTKESRIKMSKALKGHIMTEETKRKISETKRGASLSSEHKSNISKALRGTKWSHKSPLKDCKRPLEVIRKIIETKSQNKLLKPN